MQFFKRRVIVDEVSVIFAFFLPICNMLVRADVIVWGKLLPHWWW